MTENPKIIDYLFKIRNGLTTLIPLHSVSPDDFGDGEGRIRGTNIREVTDYAMVMSRAVESASVVIFNQATDFIKNLHRGGSSHKN